jgi:hypothetical protein
VGQSPLVFLGTAGALAGAGSWLSIPTRASAPLAWRRHRSSRLCRLEAPARDVTSRSVLPWAWATARRRDSAMLRVSHSIQRLQAAS